MTVLHAVLLLAKAQVFKGSPTSPALYNWTWMGVVHNAALHMSSIHSRQVNPATFKRTEEEIGQMDPQMTNCSFPSLHSFLKDKSWKSVMVVRYLATSYISFTWIVQHETATSVKFSAAFCNKKRFLNEGKHVSCFWNNNTSFSFCFFQSRLVEFCSGAWWSEKKKWTEGCLRLIKNEVGYGSESVWESGSLLKPEHVWWQF